MSITTTRYVLFDDVVNIINGKSHKKVIDNNGLYPIYGSGGSIMGYANDYICEKNSVIIGRKGSINNPIFVEEPFWNVDTAFGLSAKNNILDSKFLYYFCIQYNFEALNTTVTIPSLTKANLKKITIPLPPLPVQKKIVQVLDKAQQLIDLRENQIQLLDDLVQSVFYEMFGDPVTNPKGWDVKKLCEITNKITDGVHSKPEYTENGVPFISVKDIGTGYLVVNNCKYISQKAHETYIKRCKPEVGDLLYTKVGARYGIPAVVNTDIEFSLYVSVALIKPLKNYLNSIYLREIMRNPYVYRQAVNSIKGIGVPDLHLIEIKKFNIVLPPLALQNEFAEKVQKIEAQKVLMQQSLVEMKNNYNSLMQRAFRGDLFEESP